MEIQKASQRKLWQDLHDIADKSITKLGKAFVEANEAAISEINKTQLTKAIASGESILEEMEALAFRNYESIWPVILGVFTDSAVKTVSTIPAKRKTESLLKKAKNTINMTFDQVNPETIAFLQTYKLELITGLSENTREGIREILILGAQGQLTPRQMAEQITTLNGFGLTSRQVQSADKFRKNMEAVTIKDKLRRRLDVKRLPPDAFDFVRDRSLLTAREIKNAQIKLGRFQKKALRKRAMTIARTETIRSANAGQQQAWSQAQAQGFLPGDAKQIWIITNDDKVSNICRGIKAANTEGVPIGGAFEYSVTAPPYRIPVMRPGDSHSNCRCAVSLKGS